MKLFPHSPSARLIAATVGIAGVAALVSTTPAGAGVVNQYQQLLQAQVQDVNGAPRTGRDPAAQRQVSLAEAAGGPHVVSAAPGAGPTPAPRRPAPVSRPGTTGVLTNGCSTGYGTTGQCVPARAPGNATMTCAYLVTLFPNGVKVTGRDRLRLDTNHDGIACGPGDAGVPSPAMPQMSGMPGM